MTKASYIAIAMCLVGCEQTVPEIAQTSTTHSTQTTSTQATNPVAIGLPGYAHTVAHSRFVLGSSTATKSEFGMEKVVGSEGVFATLPMTGMTLGVPNANASSLSLARYPGSADDHNAAVRAYFVGAGLPASQILSVTPQAGMISSGAKSAAASIAPTLAYYFSTLHRQTGGVEVVDSYAWARLNTNGDVVQESVYWPDLPSDVVTEAGTFENIVNDASSLATYARSLPKDLTTTVGRLVVHHTPGEWKGTFSGAASYDVVQDGGRIRHFDRQGTEMQLDDEKPGAWGNADITPRP